MNAMFSKAVTAAFNQIMAYVCGDRAWTVAKEAVALYENQNIPKEEKRDKVFTMVFEEVRTITTEISKNLIYLAIEAALQYLRRTTKTS
jgi:hypothetical protein